MPPYSSYCIASKKTIFLIHVLGKAIAMIPSLRQCATGNDITEDAITKYDISCNQNEIFAIKREDTDLNKMNRCFRLQTKLVILNEIKLQTN
jgi:hypothetical protein